METLVLDTSVVVKWFLPEKLREQAVSIGLRMLQGKLGIICPDIMLLELANALKYSGRMSPVHISKSIRLITTLGLRMISFHYELLKMSIAIAGRYDIAIYDAYFLSLAEASDSPLVTADSNLIKKCKGHPLIVSLSDIEMESTL